jgi:hypothetical protein
MDAQPAQLESERLKILQMVESGKITASEGVSLLNALAQGSRNGAAHRPEPRLAQAAIRLSDPQNGEIRQTQGGPRWFKVRVTDLVTGKNKTSVTLPISMVDWGLRIGARYAPETDIDLSQVAEMLRMGVEGKLVDVIDEEDGEHVEIFVE